MPVGIIAAAVGGAATIAGAAISGSAASGAAKTAQNTAAANNQLQQQIYQQNSANEQPYIAAGNSATTELNGLLGIGGDSAAASTALNNYTKSAGYDFVSNAGNRAIVANNSVNGLLDSGGTLKALDQYNDGLASTYLGQYEGALSGVAGTGANSANALAGTGTNYANAVSSNNNSAASVSANAGIASASNINSLLSNAIGAYGLNKGLSSYSQPGTAANNNAATGGTWAQFANIAG